MKQCVQKFILITSFIVLHNPLSNASEIQCQSSTDSFQQPLLNFRSVDNILNQPSLAEITSDGMFHSSYLVVLTPTEITPDKVTFSLVANIPVQGKTAHLEGTLIFDISRLITGAAVPSGTGDLQLTGDLSEFHAPKINPHYKLDGCQGLF
jgi:hypothetical protein